MHPHHGEPIAPAEGAPSEYSRDQVKRGGPPWTDESRRAAASIDHTYREVLLETDARLRLDTTKEPERLVIAADEDMLPIVYALAGGRVRERRRATAE